MKHFSAKLALAALLMGGAVTASAANPFSDVQPTDWAYQAVEKLAAEGVVEGYPDGSFKGDKPITRYEMSQIVAKLMAKEGSLNADQKASVEKLSGEYADELKNLGVRVSELEKKVSDTQVILDLRFHYVPVYNDIYKNDKEDVFGARLRLNTITRVNDRVYLYGQGETLFGLSGDYREANRYTTPDGSKTYGGDDGEVTMRRLFTTYHFGSGDGNNYRGLGPSKDIIAIGQFGVKVGVTGYTYDGNFKGIMAQFGDYHEGGHFTIAYGRGTDFNYNYTAPMMRGVSGVGKLVIEKSPTVQGMIQAGLQQQGINPGDASYESAKQAAEAKLYDALKNNPGELMQTLPENVKEKLLAMSGKFDFKNDVLYPLGPEVHMNEGDDMDVPVAYASYIYKNPQKYELHFYGMRAVGPVGHIAKAYGTALSYYVTPKWNVHGEFVKNLVKLPLNNERPYGFNYGISYGTANVLEEKSYSFGVDYVYSQAGTYFGGSSNEIVDQYMGHVYNNWRGQRMPAYIADYLDDLAEGKDTTARKYGGAKFFLAKAQYVPKKGLILEANYGFGAKDMGNRKMENMFRFTATMYYK